MSPSRPGIPPGWLWEPAFSHHWARGVGALAWRPGPGAAPRAKLALDFEIHVGRVLPASPHHQLRGTRVPLGERAQVLRHGVRLVRRHLAAGQLPQGAPSDRTHSPRRPVLGGLLGPTVLHGTGGDGTAVVAAGAPEPGVLVQALASAGAPTFRGGRAWEKCSRPCSELGKMLCLAKGNRILSFG